MFLEWWIFLNENEKYVYKIYKKIKKVDWIYFPKDHEELKCLDKWKRPLCELVNLSEYKWEAFWKYVKCKWYKQK